MAAPFGMDMDLDDIPGQDDRKRSGGRRTRGGRSGGGRGGRQQQQGGRDHQQTQSGGNGGPRNGGFRGGDRRGGRDRDDQSRGGGRGGYGSGYQRSIYKERDTYERRPRPAPPAAFVTAKNRTETMIIVQNLAPHVTTEDIKEIFSSKGALRKAFVNYDDKGVSRGTAEVVYETAANADDAYAAYQGLKVDSIPLKLVLLKGDDSGFSEVTAPAPPARRSRRAYDDDLSDYSQQPRRGGPRGSDGGGYNDRRDGGARGGGGHGNGNGNGVARSARHESNRNPLLRVDGDDGDDSGHHAGRPDEAGQTKAAIFGSAHRGNGHGAAKGGRAAGARGGGGGRGGESSAPIAESDLDAMMEKYNKAAGSSGAADATADAADGGDDAGEE